MKKAIRILIGVVLLATHTQRASAGARIDLRATPGMPPGGYAPNSVINIDVFMVDTGNPEGDIPFRVIAFDFSDTTGTLSFPGADLVPANSDDNLFTWDVPFPEHYFIIPELPFTASDLTYEPPNRLFAITLPDQGEVHLGEIAVHLGMEGGILDVLNADEASPAGGASGWGEFPDHPLFGWRAYEGDLTGGQLHLVVPEPGSVALLGIVALVAMTHRKRFSKPTRCTE